MSKPFPSLKLKFGSSNSQAKDGGSPQSATSASTPKLKLKFGGGSKPSTPRDVAASPNVQLKSGGAGPVKPTRRSKPTPKKRAAEEADESEADELAEVPRPKKLKLTARAPSVSGAPLLKIKAKGRPPPRPLGVGYDSEASDREEDPTLTDNIILRMMPGDDCDYLRKAVQERNFGPVKMGGADVRLRFLSKDGRRAVIVIRGRMYAAILVDLPCILEAMKSWERKSWWKSGDVCQMLLVLGQCKTEDEAINFKLPERELDTKTWQWAHGLTPPLRWVRKRRFRKRISVRAVEEDEAEVDRLLQADEDCVAGTASYRVFASAEDYDREHSLAQGSDEEDDELDAEGEEDDELNMLPIPTANTVQSAELVDAEGEDDDDDVFAAEMERAMAEHADEADASVSTPVALPADLEQQPSHTTDTPASGPSTPIVEHVRSMDSPQQVPTSSGASDEDEDEEEESEEEEESDEDAAVMDEDALEKQQELQKQQEEIADLTLAIKKEKEALGRTANAILRGKIARRIETLESDMRERWRAMGEGDEDGDAG